MRLPRRGLLTVSLFALVATACSGGGDGVDLGDDGSDGSDGSGEASGGTLVAAIGGEPDQLDPHTTTSGFTFTVMENVYDTLVEPNADLEMEAALATDWEVSDDQLEWVFQLREGVTFHDGSEFDAEDVVASYERILEEGQNAFRLDPVASIEATGDLEVTITLDRPAPNLLAQLGAFKGMAIISADDVGGDLNESPNGTGPFAFDSQTGGDRISLTANPDYWGDEGPFLDGLEFRIIPDETVKLTNLETGEVDWIDTVPPQNIAGLEGQDQITVESVPSNDYWYVAFNNEVEPFDDPEVRRALRLALDIEAITEAVRFDAATPNQTAIPESSVWYHEYAPFETDTDEASAILEDAGVDGLTIDLMVTNEFPETVTAAEVMESQWGEIGVEVEIRTEDFNTWLADQGEGAFDAFMLGWLGNIDPDDFYYAQHHSEGVNNFQGFADPEVDDLLDQGREEVDDDARKGFYDEAAERIVDQVSYLYLYNPDLVQAWSPSVTGYEARPDQATRFKTTQIEG